MNQPREHAVQCPYCRKGKTTFSPSGVCPAHEAQIAAVIRPRLDRKKETA